MLFCWLRFENMGKLSREHLAKIGSKGGKATRRKRGKAFFREISLMRKHFNGGRPKKNKKAAA